MNGYQIKNLDLANIILMMSFKDGKLHRVGTIQKIGLQNIQVKIKKRKNQHYLILVINNIYLGTYDPVPVLFDTFWHTFAVYGKKKFNPKEPPSKFLGTADRFVDPKKFKSKKLIVPGPGNYDMIAKWPGKPKAKSKDEK